jgi:hypothetical protein
VGKAQGPRARVLVCAPSNAALDEVVLRILQHGLLDGTGQRYDPSIVRIGVNVHHSVKSVSLEKLVDAKLGVTDRVGSGLAVSHSHISAPRRLCRLYAPCLRVELLLLFCLIIKFMVDPDLSSPARLWLRACAAAAVASVWPAA